MNLFKKNSIGLEMDALEIRAVELKGSANKPMLRSWGRIALEPDIIVDGIVKNPQKLGEVLTKLWKLSKFKTKNVMLGVSNQGVIIRKADFPMVPTDKIEGLVRYQAQNYLPVSIDSVVLDYMTIGKYKSEEGDRLEVLLVAAQLDMVNGYLEALKYANLKPYDMTVAPLCLSNMLPPTAMQGIVIVVDISNELGSLLGNIDGVPRFIRSLKIRMHEVTGLNPSADSSLLRLSEEVLLSWTEILYNEIRYSINYFLSQERLNGVDKIILSGCGSRIEGLQKNLQEAFEIPIEVFDPSYKLYKLSDDKTYFKDKSTDFANCISLAITGLKG